MIPTHFGALTGESPVDKAPDYKGILNLMKEKIFIYISYVNVETESKHWL